MSDEQRPGQAFIDVTVSVSPPTQHSLEHPTLCPRCAHPAVFTFMVTVMSNHGVGPPEPVEACMDCYLAGEPNQGIIGEAPWSTW